MFSPLANSTIGAEPRKWFPFMRINSVRAQWGERPTLNSCTLSHWLLPATNDCMHFFMRFPVEKRGYVPYPNSAIYSSTSGVKTYQLATQGRHCPPPGIDIMAAFSPSSVDKKRIQTFANMAITVPIHPFWPANSPKPAADV